MIAWAVPAADETSDWSVYRGPGGDGIAVSSAPAVWSDDDVAWRTPIAGLGYSSPAVRGSQVWLTTATEDGTALTGLCLDLTTGRTLWSQRLFAVARPREKHLFNSYASPTPAVSATHAFLSWGSNGLAAVDRETFAVAWVRRDLPANHYRGAGSSPILSSDESRLFLIYDGYDHQFVECLDAATGETVWRAHRPDDFGTDDGDKKKAYATPLLIDAVVGDGAWRPELICPTSLGCFALDPQTGRELWRVTYEQFSTAGRPVFANGLLYLTTGFGKGQVHAVRPGGQGDVTDSHVVWREARTMPSKPSVLVDDGRVYALNDRGVLVTLDAATGERLSQTRLSGNFSASPLMIRHPGGESRLLLADEAGRVIAVQPGVDPQIVGESRLPDGILATPVAVGPRLLIRTRTELVCLTDGAK